MQKELFCQGFIFVNGCSVVNFFLVSPISLLIILMAWMNQKLSRWGEGWGTPWCRPYRYVPPHQVGFLQFWGLKMAIDFDFGLELDMGFEETVVVYERIYRFNSKWVRKKEKYAILNGFEESFCLRSNISNKDIIFA